MEKDKTKNRTYWIYGFSSVTAISYFIALITTYIYEGGWNKIPDVSKFIQFFVIASIISINYNIIFHSVFNRFSSSKFIIKKYDYLFENVYEQYTNTRRLPSHQIEENRNIFVNLCRDKIKNSFRLAWYNKLSWNDSDQKIINKEEVKIANIFFIISAYIILLVILILKTGITTNQQLSIIYLFILFISSFFLYLPIAHSFRNYQFLVLKNCNLINDVINHLNYSQDDLYGK